MDPVATCTVVTSQHVYDLAAKYLLNLRSNEVQPGGYLRESLPKLLDELNLDAFLECLFRTKQTQIFAESGIRGDGSDWSHIELTILGGLSMAVPVTIYDNGLHSRASVHETPFEGTLMYTPGALLDNGYPGMPADWNACVDDDGEIDPEGYYQLYKHRLLPVLRYSDQLGEKIGKGVLVTIPGLGCGCFAGPFRHSLGARLKEVLRRLIEEFGNTLSSVKVVYYDPYHECENEDFRYHNIRLMVRPLRQGNMERPQLCPPDQYADWDDDPAEFENLILVSFVAWDHVSWPGNDYYGGTRRTDDGVKAAATNSMFMVTGVEGQYDSEMTKYSPPEGYRSWNDVVEDKGVELHLVDHLVVFEE